MLKNSKLTLTLESLMTRFRIGSFLVGDQIKFLDSITKNDTFKKLPKAELDILQDIINQEKNGDVIVKIAGINQSPWIQGTPEAAPLSFDIGLDGGGGRYLNIITLPGALINEIERAVTDVNALPQAIPDNKKITYSNEPETNLELTPEDEEGKDDALSPNKQKIHKMPTKDNKIPGKKMSTVDYKKDIKSTMGNGGKLDTKAKA